MCLTISNSTNTTFMSENTTIKFLGSFSPPIMSASPVTNLSPIAFSASRCPLISVSTSVNTVNLVVGGCFGRSTFTSSFATAVASSAPNQCIFASDVSAAAISFSPVSSSIRVHKN